MMKTLFILHSPKCISRIKKPSKNDIIITSNLEVQEELQRIGLEYKTNEDYLNEKDYENIGREAIELVRKWGKLKVNGKTMEEFLTYGDLPFWDLIESSFATLLFESSKKLHHIKLMKKVILTEKPDKILAGDINILGRVAICVAKSFGIEVEKIDTGIVENLRYYYDTRLKNYFFRYANRLKEFERAFFMKKIKKWFKDDKKKILIIPTIQTETPMVAPVINELEKNENYELLTLRIGSLRKRMEKSLGRRGIKNTPVEAFVTKETKERINNAVKFLKERWKIFKTSEEFKNSLKYMKIPVWDLVREDFEFYFSTRARIFEVVKYIETIREIIDNEQPDLILTLDELSELGKPMSLFARKRKIPLLIIQHGLFTKGSFIYGPSLATKICLWGPYVKKLLLKRWFNKKQLVVTGCPKFDALAKKGFVGKERLCRELNLDPDKEIVLFASEPITEIERTADTVLKTMKKFPDKQLVVKLHPREYNEPLYKRLANKFSINVVITRDFDLYQLLANCKFLITPFSTVGIEALILNKPVITMSLSEPNPMYAGTGVTIEVNRPEKLVSVIKSLEDPEVIKKLERGRKKFIYEYGYKIDGKATERIVDLIETSILEFNR